MLRRPFSKGSGGPSEKNFLNVKLKNDLISKFTQNIQLGRSPSISREILEMSSKSMLILINKRAEPPGRRSFEKICKKINENLQVFKKFSRKFRDFFKFFFKFYRISGENLEKSICMGFGGGAPRR